MHFKARLLVRAGLTRPAVCTNWDNCFRLPGWQNAAVLTKFRTPQCGRGAPLQAEFLKFGAKVHEGGGWYQPFEQVERVK